MGFIYEEKDNLAEEMFQLKFKEGELKLKLADSERQLFRLNYEIEKKEKRFKSLHCQKKIDSSKGTILFVTPTYKRYTQKADLVRLSQTLSHISNLLWIVVEDDTITNYKVEEFLEGTKIPFVYLAAKTPEQFKLKNKDPNWKFPRGISQRNIALEWVRINYIKNNNAVLYFGDDDNTYDLALFREMRNISNIGLWPVGIVGGLLAEGPIVSGGKITGFNSIWKPERYVPMDFAGFALNVTTILNHPEVKFRYETAVGLQESSFIQDLEIDFESFEPKAQNCSKVYVWHTRTEKYLPSKQAINKINGDASDDAVF
uniref:Galactosylgalactosylxylosylprotein 3-beta-glucuronosyltransferase n=1 Tax=Rhabditophanes sp. KR3021 TaxID=114890 RepID=A0AC35TNI0_9BILA